MKMCLQKLIVNLIEKLQKLHLMQTWEDPGVVIEKFLSEKKLTNTWNTLISKAKILRHQINVWDPFRIVAHCFITMDYATYYWKPIKKVQLPFTIKQMLKFKGNAKNTERIRNLMKKKPLTYMRFEFLKITIKSKLP